MREVFLGEVIRQRRLELGLTQERLCEGICEPMTVSRIENWLHVTSTDLVPGVLWNKEDLRKD